VTSTEHLLLRPAETADAPELADLFLSARRAAHPAMPLPVHSDAAVHAWFTRRLEQPPPRTETWVAEAGPRHDAAVAYLTLEADWLHSLYVLPELTGQGVGATLLDLAKGLRPAGFGLWVFESNQGARRFYRRHGLRELRRTDGSENEEREPDIEMRWRPDEE
jgi:GNAT superfamily N-acetyltransferase